MAWSKPSGLCLATGSLLAAGLNLALPHDDDPHRFVALVAESDVWGLLHAGLVVAVLLVAAGLHGVLDATGADGPRRTGLGDGALWVGTGLMLAGLLVAGVAMEKAADDFVGAIPEDRAATFFSVVSFDRLSYALFAGAAVVLLGLVPILLGAALRRDHPVLGLTGLAAGGLAAVVGLAELVVRDVDTSLLYLAGSLAVTLWCLAVGAAPLVFGVREGRR